MSWCYTFIIEAIVRGLRVDTLDVAVVEVSELPMVGEDFLVWSNAIIAWNEFIWPREELDSSSQGTKRLSLPWLWASVVVYIIKYLTCDGRQSLLYTINFKLISHLHHERLMNVPNFLYNLLKIIFFIKN